MSTFVKGAMAGGIAVRRMAIAALAISRRWWPPARPGRGSSGARGRLGRYRAAGDRGRERERRSVTQLWNQDQRDRRLLGRQLLGPSHATCRHLYRDPAGNVHTCAIRTNGTLACWGDNSSGRRARLQAPSAQSRRQRPRVRVRTNGTLACWGDNSYGQATAPAGTFTAVGGGGYHTCAIRTNGTLACWGYNVNGQATPPAGTFAAISEGGFNHTCAIRTNGTLACWGWGGRRAAPSRPPGPSSRSARAAPTAAAIRTNGTSPAGATTPRAKPRHLPAPSPRSAAAAGHSCATRTNGTIACWGDNDHGQATAPAGTFTGLSERGRLSHVWDKNDRHRCMLGRERQRAGQPARGDLHRGQRRAYHTCGSGRAAPLACWG